MTKEHTDHIGMAHGANAANDAKGEGNQPPYDYHEALTILDELYQEAMYRAEAAAIARITKADIMKHLTVGELYKWNQCQACIKAWKNSPNGC